jgi:hypothetical protein
VTPSYFDYCARRESTAPPTTFDVLEFVPDENYTVVEEFFDTPRARFERLLELLRS